MRTDLKTAARKALGQSAITDLQQRVASLESEIEELRQQNLRLAEIADVVQELLDTAGLRVEDVAGWAVHPGGPRILDVARDQLGLTEDQIAPSRRVLAEHGNCSSATVLLVLEELGPVDGPVVAMAFGPGLTLYATLLLPA